MLHLPIVVARLNRDFGCRALLREPEHIPWLVVPEQQSEPSGFSKGRQSEIRNRGSMSKFAMLIVAVSTLLVIAVLFLL